MTSTGRRAALMVAGLLALLVAFQVALAAGAPLGRAAWGGKHATLPIGLRLATVVAVAIYTAGGLVVLRRAGYRIGLLSPTAARRGTWLFATVLGLSALTNLASHSGWERFLMAPMALVLAALATVVAVTGRTSGSDSDQGKRRVGGKV